MNLRSETTHIDQISLTSTCVDVSPSSRLTLKSSVLGASVDDQKAEVVRKSKKMYGQDPKPLQIAAVISLIQDKNTFLMVGTGYGKTRVAELFMRMYFKCQKTIVLVINPLDALGENQVSIPRLFELVTF